MRVPIRFFSCMVDLAGGGDDGARELRKIFPFLYIKPALRTHEGVIPQAIQPYHVMAIMTEVWHPGELCEELHP